MNNAEARHIREIIANLFRAVSIGICPILPTVLLDFARIEPHWYFIFFLIFFRYGNLQVRHMLELALFRGLETKICSNNSFQCKRRAKSGLPAINFGETYPR